jgi:hypothetical protein
MKRNRIAVWIIVSAVLALPAVDRVRAADDPPAKWTGRVTVPSNLGFATSTSPDGLVTTVLFDNLLVSTEPAGGTAQGVVQPTAVDSRVATLHVPIEAKAGEPVKVWLDVRGYVLVHPAARVALVVHAGEKTAAVDVLGSIPVPPAPPVELKGQAKQTAIANDPPPSPEEKNGDFMTRIEVQFTPRSAHPVLPVTLMLLAERDTGTPGAGGTLLVIDSLDLSVATATKDAAQTTSTKSSR